MNLLKKKITNKFDDLLDFEFESTLTTLKKSASYIIAKKCLVTFLLILLGSIFLTPSINSDTSTIVINNEFKEINITHVLQKMILLETESYIKRIAPESKLKADTLIKICLKYNFDICFVLAQGHLESHFGTRGLASETNSVFNVGTYDDGSILYTYKDPNESIEPYIKLLKNNYLNNSNNIKLLMKNYKNKNGYRYAKSRKYEKSLKIVYSRIVLDSTIIKFLQDMYECEIRKQNII